MSVRVRTAAGSNWFNGCTGAVRGHSVPVMFYLFINLKITTQVRTATKVLQQKKINTKIQHKNTK